MKSSATTVQQYLDDLPEDRRESIKAVREVILKNLPKGYEEVMNWGMICYQVPFAIYPDTYNKQPLMFAALASQKNNMAVYLTGLYMNGKLREDFLQAYKESGKKLDIGGSCVRFKKLENLPLDLIGKYIARMPLEDCIKMYEQSRSK